MNPASGGNFRACGDILDLHNYPGPAMYLFDPVRVNVLGEYGGMAWLWRTICGGTNATGAMYSLRIAMR